MASGSGLGVDIVNDSSSSSPETDSDSDGNVCFSEFDSDSGSDDDAFLGFGNPGDTPVFTCLSCSTTWRQEVSGRWGRFSRTESVIRKA